MRHSLTVMAVAAMVAGCAAPQPQLTRSGLNPDDFKSEYNAKATALYTLTNENGMEVCITNFGGRIVSVMVPDKDGNFRDVVLGFDNVKDYFPENNKTDFGACIGRYANRIAQARFTLDGKEYLLGANNYGHCLHGGPTGWQYQVYDVVEADASHLKLTISSPDGDNGFPGNVTAGVTYTLTGDNSIDMVYEAETDAATVINMTNHSYFNLSGDPSLKVDDNVMVVNASFFTPVDTTFMTDGGILPVDGTPMDFRCPRPLGPAMEAFDFEQIKNGNGIDHNWVLSTGGDITVPAVSLSSPVSGIVLTEYTTEPGMQIYTGNFLDGTVTGKNSVTYNFRTAVCLESQKYPDTPNKPQWPSAVLRPGEKYTSHSIFAFSVIRPDGGCCGKGGDGSDCKGGDNGCPCSGHECGQSNK